MATERDWLRMKETKGQADKYGSEPERSKGRMSRYAALLFKGGVALAIGCGSIALWGSGKDAAAIAAEAAASTGGTLRIVGKTADSPLSSLIKRPVAEVEYWSYDAGAAMNRPLALPGGRLLVTTQSGLISIIDREGKRVFHKNQYTSLTAPTINESGDIWIAGSGARLYRFKANGEGEQAGIFYFQKKTEGLLPSAPIVDGKGRPYFHYEHAVLSLGGKGEKEMALLPVGVKVLQLAPASEGVYALGSDGVLYAAKGGELRWQAKLNASLHKASMAADGSGGLVLAAAGRIAAFDADGQVRFERQLPAPSAGGFSSPIVIGGDEKLIVAAELSGNDVVAFRLADGAERWRISASGAGGFGPAALAPEAGGLVLAAARSGAVLAIDGTAGSIVSRFNGAAANAAGGVAPLGAGRIAYASGSVLAQAGPYRPVTITYEAAALKLALGERLLLADGISLSSPVEVSYKSDNAKVLRVSPESIVTPLAAGKANLLVDVTTQGYRGQLKLPVEVKAASASLKATHQVRKIEVSGKTFSVHTATIPNGMPVTVGIASRAIGNAETLAGIGKSYGASVAINGTYFSAYDGIPQPYGTLIANGKLAFIGNTGTTVGFTWDGTVMMDHLRTKIVGGTNGSFTHPNNWYAYFVNRVPTKGATTAVMFTPDKGTHIGFDYGSSVTVRGGVVTRKDRNKNAAIPADGYVLVFAGSEEKLADRFQVGTKVEYKVETKNLKGETLDWSRVHSAVGAGPRLVKDGKLALHASAEGFTETKILTSAAARSGILVKKDGTVILATVPAATMKQWADIMIKLGAQQAMNLDGGASSGLYVNGKTEVTPGRELSNALVFGSGLKW